MDFIAKELSTIVKNSLHHILRSLFYKAQSAIPSVMYKAVEKIRSHLLFKEDIGETLEADMTKLFDSDAMEDRGKNDLLA